MDRQSAADLAAATPTDRDRVVDFVRVAAVAVVVVGHWLLAVVTWDEGGLHGANLLQVAPWTRWLTWVFQVMPLFFLAGGVANAASWAAARRRHLGYPAWLHGRVDRLIRPVVALVGAWTAGIAVAAVAGADLDVLGQAGRLVAMPVWFLAVYLGVVAVTPVMVWWHDRSGWWAPAALAGGAVLVDVAALGSDRPGIGWANFAFVWLFAHQLGFAWRSGRLRAPGVAPTLAALGLAVMVACTQLLDYPTAMVGGPGEPSNTTPPTVALLGLALAQAGVLSLARPRLSAWLMNRRPWTVVIAANGLVMTLFLWHLTALCLASLLLAAGWFPQAEPASVTWWLHRPVWLVVLATVMVPLVLLWGRVERAPRPGRVSRSGSPAIVQAALGTVVAVIGLACLAVGGVPVPGRPLTVPLLGLVLPLIGAALVRDTLLRELSPLRRSDDRRTVDVQDVDRVLRQPILKARRAGRTGVLEHDVGT